MPFLKNKNQQSPGIIVQTRPSDQKPEVEGDEEDSSAGIESCAEELIRAVHSRDVKAVAAAIEDAFEILEASESESDDDDSEEDHVNPHSYDSQNIKAGKE